MAHHEFNDLKHAAAALPPEQMKQLRDELDRTLAERAAAGTPVEAGQPDDDPLLGLWRDYADEMDVIVADAYRKRREETWREFEL
jgi:hypothetical protein